MARRPALALALLALLATVAATGSVAAGVKKKPKPKVVRIAEPGALALDSRGGLMVADRKLNRLVRIDLRTGKRRVTVSGLRDIVAVAFDDTNRLYVGAGDRIYRIEAGRKIVVAGTGRRAHEGDGGPAAAASLSGLGGFEVDHDESIVIAEYDNWIRFVDANGTISTLAGTGDEGYAGDGGPATAALLRHPHDLALRVDREVIIADSHNGVLRRIDPAGRISTFASGFGAPVAVKAGREIPSTLRTEGQTPSSASRRTAGRDESPGAPPGLSISRSTAPATYTCPSSQARDAYSGLRPEGVCGSSFASSPRRGARGGRCAC